MPIDYRPSYACDNADCDKPTDVSHIRSDNMPASWFVISHDGGQQTYCNAQDVIDVLTRELAAPAAPVPEA